MFINVALQSEEEEETLVGDEENKNKPKDRL